MATKRLVVPGCLLAVTAKLLWDGLAHRKQKSMEGLGMLLGLSGTMAYFSHVSGGWASAWLGYRRTRPPATNSLDGRVVVVTGGNAGIGLGVVRLLAQAGATVVLCSRSLERGEKAKRSLAEAGINVKVMELDLASFKSVHAFAKAFREQHQRLDVLVLNGGFAQSFTGRGAFNLTTHGFEEMMGVNFLGHYLLTRLLLPLLRDTPGARVVANSSVACASSYPEGILVKSWTQRVPQFADWAQYGQSKLALAVFIRQLQAREPSLLCVSCHPGNVASTGLMHERSTLLERLFGWFIFTFLAMRFQDGPRCTAYLATTEDKLERGGFYWPTGRFVKSIESRVFRAAALQLPVRVATEHPGLWDKAEAALRDVGVSI